jgi:hypothetical protein
MLPCWLRYDVIALRSTLAADIVRHTPSGTRTTAESSSWSDPRRAKEKGEPGRNEEFRSPRTFADGCSRNVWRAVTGERCARAFFAASLSLSLLWEEEEEEEGGDGSEDRDAGGGAACGAGAAPPTPDAVACDDFDDDDDDDFCCLSLISPPFSDDDDDDDDDCGGGGGSTSRYVVLGRGKVSLATLRADVKSCFSAKPDASMQYRSSSSFSSEIFILEMSGR